MTWHKDNEEAAFIAGILKRPLVFHRILVDIPVTVNGKNTRLGILGALMLSQAIYWEVRTPNGKGWFYKARWEWEQETGMTRREQETARRRLRATPFWAEKQMGFPPKLHYRVDLALLAQTLKQMLTPKPVNPPPVAETDHPIGTNAPNWEENPAAETDQPISTNAPNWEENPATETEQPIGTDAPNWEENPATETEQPIGTDAPKRGASIGTDAPTQLVQMRPPFGTNAPTQLVQMRPPFGTNAPKRQEGALKELLTETTSKTTSQRLTTAAAINARVNAPPPQVAAAAAANSTSPPPSQSPPKPKTPRARKQAPEALPDDVREDLRALGWVGNLAEVQRAWKHDPERVRAWIAYVRRKGGGGGLLRKLLREEPGYPPDEPSSPDPFAGWADFATGVGDDDGSPGTTASPEGGGAGASVPVATATPPDIGALPPPTPDMRRWWAFAVGQIRAEMSKADFDTWLRPVRLVACNGDDSRLVFVVATANDYAQRWLAERVSTTLQRKLAGFAGKPVEVRFVVG